MIIGWTYVVLTRLVLQGSLGWCGPYSIYLQDPSIWFQQRKGKMFTGELLTVWWPWRGSNKGFTASGVQSIVRTRERLKAISCWRFSESAEETEMLVDGRHTNKTRVEEPQWPSYRVPGSTFPGHGPCGALRYEATSLPTFLLSLSSSSSEVFHLRVISLRQADQGGGSVKKEIPS